jgi:hypothetical protein
MLLLQVIIAWNDIITLEGIKTMFYVQNKSISVRILKRMVYRVKIKEARVAQVTFRERIK